MELQTEIVQIEKNKKLGAQTQNSPQVTKTHKQDAFKPPRNTKNKNKTKQKEEQRLPQKQKQKEEQHLSQKQN